MLPFYPDEMHGKLPRGNPPISEGAQLYIEPLEAGTLKTGSYQALYSDSFGLKEALVGVNSSVWIPRPKANLWLSAHGTTRQHKPHWDNYEGVMCVIKGTKVIDLISPKYTKDLYVVSRLSDVFSQKHFRYKDGAFSTSTVYDPSYWTNTQYSVADIYNADEAFPKLKNNKSTRCTIHGGDALYIPIGYWHVVHSFTDPGRHGKSGVTLAVNYWYDSALRAHRRVVENLYSTIDEGNDAVVEAMERAVEKHARKEL